VAPAGSAGPVNKGRTLKPMAATAMTPAAAIALSMILVRDIPPF
jgi:hypothetical protein